MLTEAQSNKVKVTLITSGIKHFEVYQEFADHYMAAIEEQLQEGIAFEQALGAIHTEFGEKGGLKALEKEALKNARRAYLQLHWQEITAKFSWPQGCAVLFVGLVSYFLSLYLRGELILVSLLLLSFIPLFFMSFSEASKKDLVWTSHSLLPKTLLGEALRVQMAIALVVLYVAYFGSLFLFGEIADAYLSGNSPALNSCLLTGYFMYVWSYFSMVKNTNPRLTLS